MARVPEWSEVVAGKDAELKKLRAALEQIRDAGPMTIDDQRWRIARAALEAPQERISGGKEGGMSNIINLSEHQEPVRYVLEITQHYDGRVEAFVRDVVDDERSRDAVTSALLRVVEARLNRRVGHAGDAMLAFMLANIDHAMNCTEDNPAVFKVGPQELSAWADAVAEYEEVRFPIHGDKVKT